MSGWRCNGSGEGLLLKRGIVYMFQRSAIRLEVGVASRKVKPFLFDDT